jgi:hypothetical protein
MAFDSVYCMLLALIIGNGSRSTARPGRKQNSISIPSVYKNGGLYNIQKMISTVSSHEVQLSSVLNPQRGIRTGGLGIESAQL